jgi:hypothetical protein
MSAFQPNKFQPIWRYIQKDITILSLVVGSSRKSEILFIFLIFVPFLVFIVRQPSSTSPSCLPLRVPPSKTMQHIHVTCSSCSTCSTWTAWTAWAAPSPSQQQLQAAMHACFTCKTAAPLYTKHQGQQHGMEKLNLLDSSSMVCTIPQSWTAPATLHLACSTLSHSSSCTFSSQLDSSFSSLPRLLQQPAAAGQLLDNSFSSCSFWQHLQGAEPLLDSSMGCTCPPHQQHLQGSSMGRHSTGGTAPILSFPQAGSKDKRGGESLKKEKTIRKIRRKRGEKKGGSSSNIIGQKLSVDSKGMEGFSTPNSQRLSMHS